MTGGFGTGAIRVEIALDGDRVRAARVVSSRPTGHGRLFVGRQGSEAAVVSRRLFTLCARAQAAAAAEAIAAAQGARRSEAQRALDRIAVLSERVCELLRAALVWPWGDGPPRAVAAPLREAMAAAAVLDGLTEASLSDRGALRAAASRLAAAASALGAPIEPDGRPAPGTPFAAIAADCAAAPALLSAPPDPLTRADDVAVVAGLRADPEGFAARPALAGRRPETGAYARRWRAASSGEGLFTARLSARLLDVGETLAALRGAIEGEADPEAALIGAPAGEGCGFSAVECARGRLYHWAQVQGDGKIAAYAVLAPTEWNFHADGPYVAALLGADLGEGEPARLAAARLAALIDPCVAFSVALAA